MCPSFLPGSRPCLFLFFCGVGFADSACPMTFGRVATVQPKAVTLVKPLSSFVRQDVVPNTVNIKKKPTPLERELEAVEGGQWAPSETSPFCWPVVSTASTLTMMIYILTGMSYLSEYRSSSNVECMVTAMQRRNFVALTLSGWHNLKLCKPDSVRATKFRQLLRSSRLCRIFGTELMGSRRSE